MTLSLFKNELKGVSYSKGVCELHDPLVGDTCSRIIKLLIACLQFYLFLTWLTKSELIIMEFSLIKQIIYLYGVFS